MARNKIKIGPFTTNWEEFCRWFDGPFRDIETEGSEANLRFREKFLQASKERPHLFFDNSKDKTNNRNFLEMIVECQSPIENDYRTKDLPIVRKRWGKFQESDNAYTVVPVARVVGRDKWQMETFNGRKALYIALIEDIVQVEEGFSEIIPTNYTVKYSKKTFTPEGLDARIKSHDNADDSVRTSHIDNAVLHRNSLSKYEGSYVVNNGTSMFKHLGFKGSSDALTNEICGPLCRAYIDSLEENYIFPTMKQAYQEMIDSGILEKDSVPVYRQAGFMRGVLARLLQAIEEETVTVDRGVQTIRRILNVGNSLSLREKVYLKDAIKLFLDMDTETATPGKNAVDRHHVLGSKFVLEALKRENANG